MSVASTSTSASTSADAWDQSLPAPAAPRRAAPAQAVPDAWDDDDDDDDDEEEEDPQKLWESANSKAPMPELVISGASTASVVSPPPAAFQPALRILKRPPAASSAPRASSASSVPAPPELRARSYAEREAQYQAARERIFRDGRDGAGAGAGAGASVKVLREPRGPEAPPDEGAGAETGASRGFAARRGAPHGR
ncbi:hypothetical protein WOLCODRAFT_140947 [Wolfiporia cocos MD-104 SS10]|uniref:SUZ domain-containing protein n=1 Tax=Wolfiporia cocos (strain MD-104) TaxID=742152 RepID=A0A2H3JLR5_WOLCO|nr:hypothetical protein WOLCODRAFT_140947 [Wolfiporia cocos MD-104 SS10]